ncbi:MAG TPA: response regulator [Gemmatimonadaceae bacterium]|nr:response regulator [Gemmatimonadaceae bacterium]
MKPKILVVEDSATQGEALRDALDTKGFDVELVTSGEVALKALESAGSPGFDMVVSDVVMPGIDGYELCRRIKTGNYGDMPVVLLTSLTDPMAIVRGLECGADNYVTKPYALPHLLARIRHALDKHTLRTGSKSSMGINVRFLDTNFTITSGKEQILDLFISSIEDVVRMNDALLSSQRELAETQKQLEEFAARMARQAQVTAERYSALMHSANDAIFVLERDGRIADANERAAELLGEKRPLLGRKLLDFGTPESRQQLRDLLESLKETGRVSRSNISFARSNDRVLYCDVSVSKSGDKNEALSLVILHDVTERRINEEGLRRSREQLAEAQHVAALGSFEWVIASDTVVWSDETFRLFGVLPGSFVPSYSTFMSYVHPEDRHLLEDALQSAMSEGQAFAVEYRAVRSDKSVRHFHTRGQIRRDPTGAPVSIVGSSQDITERKNLEQQLRQSQKMDAIGQLAGGIAHDFNNLLTVIHGNSDLALDSLDSSSSVHGDISEIKRAATSAAALTQQLLAFSRRQILQPRPIQLRAIAMGVERMLGRLLGENIELVLELDEDAGFILADSGQIEQVLINLTVNARDAMPDGGRITISSCSTRINGSKGSEICLPPGDYEVLTVTDTGTGMDQATRERIFEPFFTTKPAGRGTGLGLSTVHGIVKQSGGELQVATTVGKGSSFTIYFPRVSTTVVADATRIRNDASGGSETILLVEDEAALRNLARRVLTKKGYSVFEAGNAEEAIRIHETSGQNFDLIVTDVVMPGLDSRTMVERIAKMKPGIKVLFMSGYHDDHVMMQSLAGAKIEFLHKPFSPQDLADKVRAVLDSRRSTETV